LQAVDEVVEGGVAPGVLAEVVLDTFFEELLPINERQLLENG